MLALIFFRLANHMEQNSTVVAALHCCKCYIHLNHTNIRTEQIQGRFHILIPQASQTIWKWLSI